MKIKAGVYGGNSFARFSRRVDGRPNDQDRKAEEVKARMEAAMNTPAFVEQLRNLTLDLLLTGQCVIHVNHLRH